MAKPGILEKGEPTTKATELKKELRRLVKGILEDEEDCGVHAYDRAREIVLELRDCRLKKEKSSVKIESLEVPDQFLCPLSREVMWDPVVLASGQTYERRFIQARLDTGSRTCPQTQQVLPHTNLVPNYLVREMLMQWCKSKGVEVPNPVDSTDLEQGITKGEKERFDLLLIEVRTKPLPEQRLAAKELRSLTKRMPAFRSLFGQRRNSIRDLLAPLELGKDNCPPDLHEDLVTTILNLSILDENKTLIADTPGAIPLLIESVKDGTIETRTNAAAALFSLSALDDNKSAIGLCGALKPLIELLRDGHPLGMKDAASAIFNLCITRENKMRAVRDGAIAVIMEKLKNRIHVDELLAILAMLSTHQKAIEEMVELGAVNCLLSIIKESTCGRNKENCIAILHSICLQDRGKLRELREEERANHTISELAEQGTSRARRKAGAILERLVRAGLLTYSA